MIRFLQRMTPTQYLWVVGFTLFALVALVLAGCSSPADVVSTQPAATSSTAVEPSSTPTQDDRPASFGDRATYDDDVSIVVQSARDVARDAYAAGGKPGDRVVLVKVQALNGSPDTLDLSLAQVTLRYGPDGTEAEAVYQDGAQNGWEAPVRPGGSATVTWGFAVPRKHVGGSVEVGVAPTWEHETTVWRGHVR